MQYTYIQHDDNLVEIVETGGLFFGYTVDQVRQAAENTKPNYQHSNLSYTFSDQYFNYSVRKALLCLELTPTMTLQTTAHGLQTNSDESGRSESSTDRASLSV